MPPPRALSEPDEERNAMIEIPEIIAALIAAAGEDTVLAFLEAHGGTRLWVPRDPLKSQLCGMYGDELA